jgi:hypothetical protein
MHRNPLFTINDPMLSDFLNDLKSTDLAGISLNPQTLGLRLDFTFGLEADDVAIEFYHIIHLNFSQPVNANDEDICFWVGEVELKQIENYFWIYGNTLEQFWFYHILFIK